MLNFYRALTLAILVIGTARAQSQSPPEPGHPSKADVTPTELGRNEGQLEYIISPESRNRTRLDSYWENGYHIEASDKSFRLCVGGNAQIDSTWLIGPQSIFALPNGEANGVGNSSATFLRRARIRLEGSVYEQFDYIIEYDFANANNENDGLQPPSFNNLIGSPAPANVWMQIRDLPFFGNVRIGNQVKPIGMTNNTNQGQLDFMERADNNDAFYGPFDNGFALGITSRNVAQSERATWQYGIYRPSTNVFGVALRKSAIGSRITALPWYEEEGRRLTHLGFGVWASELPQEQLRVRARPLLRNGPGFAAPVIVDTGNLPGGRQAIFAPELAAVSGPWTLQAEYAGQFLTDADLGGVSQGTVFFHGGYVELMYFLTGEHRDYIKQEGVFGRVVPRNNFSWTRCGFQSGGAWQVGARFGYLDLTDKDIDGGQLYDWTVGVNWFLNPNMKFQLNYILEHRDGQQNVAQGWFNGVGVRAAFDF